MARNHGEKRNCGGCRFWSEMIAQSIGGGPIEAYCLAPKADSPYSHKYVRETQACDGWKSGHHGAVDAPPNYGEESRVLYAAEDSPF